MTETEFVWTAWMEKDDPTQGDVHVDKPMGSETPPAAPKPPTKRPKAKPLRVPDQGEQPSMPSMLKVDDGLGLVFGWAIVSKVDGEPYFDVQGDHIPEESMLNASADFMQNSRVSREMHTGSQSGTVVFAWPMTGEIAKAMGIDTTYTGLMIAIKPSDPSALAKFRDGTYTGFSIGGSRVVDEAVS